MSRRLKIVVGVAVAAVLALGLATAVFAQSFAEEPGDWQQQMWQACHGDGASSGLMGPGGMTGAGGMMGFGGSDQVAKLLGITPQDLTTQRNAGTSIFEIAKAKGFGEQQVLDAALAPIKDSLALRVEYGYLTQAQADQALQQHQTALNNAFSATGTTGPQGRFGGRGMMGGYGGGSYGGGMMGGYGGGFGGMMGRTF